MDRNRLSPNRPSPGRFIATMPMPIRVLAGLGLLALCVWLPAAVALFR